MRASGEASGNGACAVVENVTFDEIQIGQSASLSRAAMRSLGDSRHCLVQRPICRSN